MKNCGIEELYVLRLLIFYVCVNYFRIFVSILNKYKLIMKRNLLLLGVVLSANFCFSQSIINENFESLTNGNLGTDITGTTAGQGGWYTTAAAAAANSAVSNFVVQANNATHGKVLSILGSAGPAGTKQINQNNKLTSVWATRTPGNEVLQYEFDVYSGATTTSQNTARVYLWDGSAANKCVVGFTLNMATKQHTLVAYSDPLEINGQDGEVGNWGYTFNAALEAATWYKVGIAWNHSSGEIAYKIVDDATGDVVFDEVYQGAAAGASPDLANIQVQAVPNATVTANSVAATILFDNINLKATDVVNLLAVNDVVKSKVSVAVYPNPTSDFLKFDTNLKVDAAQVFDVSGKSVDVKVLNNQIDVRNLAKGVYLIKISTVDGISTQKFIKK